MRHRLLLLICSFMVVTRMNSLPRPAVPVRWPTSEELWAAVVLWSEERQLPLPAGGGREHLTWAAVPIVEEKVALAVRGAAWDARQKKVDFTLGCHPSHGCLPFHVLLDCSPSGCEQLRSAFLSSRKSAEGRSAILFQPLKTKASPLVRSGEKAHLEARFRELYLSAPVVCLENGALNQLVRVRNVATGRVVMARVIGRGVLISSWED